jgi:hypothetical protein
MTEEEAEADAKIDRQWMRLFVDVGSSPNIRTLVIDITTVQMNVFAAYFPRWI